MCEKSQKIRFFGSILYFANLKVTVAKYRLLSVRFEFITRNLFKNKCMKNYTQKSREKIMFQISTNDKYTHLNERFQYSYNKKNI